MKDILKTIKVLFILVFVSVTLVPIIILAIIISLLAWITSFGRQDFDKTFKSTLKVVLLGEQMLYKGKIISENQYLRDLGKIQAVRSYIKRHKVNVDYYPDHDTMFKDLLLRDLAHD